MKMPNPIAIRFAKLIFSILSITVLGVIFAMISHDHKLLILSAGVAITGGVKACSFYRQVSRQQCECLEGLLVQEQVNIHRKRHAIVLELENGSHVQRVLDAKATTASNQPMRNFLFRGEAGTGKTMGAQAIAAGLNLPYTLMTCSANTEITDLVGQFIPDTNGFHGSTPIEDLPKISDITMHPPSVYMMLTGEYDESKTEDDVLQKLIEIAVGNLMEKEDPAGQRIRYVDTPLVEAIRHGYVCELQEPSCIANPGVLVGLNSLLDNCQVITLPTGERVRRHPDTVIVVTTNSDYSGCRDMNQSVISRMDLIYDMEAPDLNTMVKRVMNVTGFTDEQEATKMAIVVRDIAERCRQTMITDGSCGMREFKSWVLSTMVTNDPYESALSTIISSASADPDNRAELISACLEPQYSKTI